MFRSLNDVIAPNGMDKLPMLPNVHDVYRDEMGMLFGAKPKTKRKPVKKSKTVVKKSKSKPVKKRKPVPKSLKTRAKKLGIKLTVKRGDKRVAKTEKVLRTQIKNKMAKKSKMAKKRPVTKRKKNSKFGTYWDNTQLLYAPSAASQQPAGTTGGNQYPYEGDMTPYFDVAGHTTVPFSMFGKRSNNRFGMQPAPMNRGMWNTQTPMGQGVSRNYCESGTQCGSFPRSVEQAYPFTTDMM